MVERLRSILALIVALHCPCRLLNSTGKKGATMYPTDIDFSIRLIADWLIVIAVFGVILACIKKGE